MNPANISDNEVTGSGHFQTQFTVFAWIKKGKLKLHLKNRNPETQPDRGKTDVLEDASFRLAAEILLL